MSLSGTSIATREIERLLGIFPRGFDLSLDRIRALLADLGSPQSRLPPVIHIAGTNGKGSATAFCRALLEASGLNVHVHTSPHLVNWHERYRLGKKGGGELVNDAVLAEAILRVERVNDGRTITVFELLTAVTFVLFSEHPADAVILEVGLGGRFDATNVIDRPAVSLIMPVALDHQAWLGDNVELIAAEKAGIIKRHCPVVLAEQRETAALDVLTTIAHRLSAPLFIYGQDFHAFSENGRLVYQDEFGLYDLPTPALPGRHQYGNAAASIRAVKAAGFTITQEIAETALKSVEWPARLQRLTSGILVDLVREGSEIWLDGGHNPHGGRAIAEAMADFEERQSRPLYLIIGMINTKDPSGYFEAFRGLAVKVFTAPILESDAGLDPVLLADSAFGAGLLAEPVSSVKEALLKIAKLSINIDVPPRILIGGSLYFAGDILSQNGTPPT